MNDAKLASSETKSFTEEDKRAATDAIANADSVAADTQSKPDKIDKEEALQVHLHAEKAARIEAQIENFSMKLMSLKLDLQQTKQTMDTYYKSIYKKYNLEGKDSINLETCEIVRQKKE